MKRIDLGISRHTLTSDRQKTIYHAINSYFLGLFGDHEHHAIGADLETQIIFVVYFDPRDDDTKVFQKLSGTNSDIETDIKRIINDIKKI